MSIDLTKPIRRKDTLERVNVDIDETPISVEGRLTRFHYVSVDHLERHYENIPEPRKPREWMATVGGDKRDLWPCRDYSGEKVRVIEWPLNAELPALPEQGEGA